MTLEIAVFFTTVSLYVDWSGTGYSLLNLFLIFGCKTPNFKYLRFSTLHSSSSWIIITFAIIIKKKAPPLC